MSTVAVFLMGFGISNLIVNRSDHDWVWFTFLIVGVVLLVTSHIVLDVRLYKEKEKRYY